MSNIKWMDYSGSPGLMIPVSLLGFWGGFYVPMENEKRPDLMLGDGRQFRVCDDFDFENPQTDYDRICARANSGGESHFLYPVGPSQALVIADCQDGTIVWWADQKVVVTASYRHLPDPGCLDQLEWSNEVRWNVTEKRLVLINSCVHGANANEEEDEFTEVELEPGVYSVTSAWVREHHVMVYRFRCMANLRESDIRGHDES